MGDKVFLRQKWTRYLGELRPIHDIDVFFVPSTPSPTPSLTPTLTPTITPTKTITPTITNSPTPSVTVTNTLTPTITPTSSCSPFTTQYMKTEQQGNNQIKFSVFTDAGYTNNTTAVCDYLISGTYDIINGSTNVPYSTTMVTGNHTHTYNTGNHITGFTITSVVPDCVCVNVIANIVTPTPTPSVTQTLTPSITPSLTPTNTLTPTITQTNNIGYAGTYYSASTYCDACNKINGNFVTLYTTGTCINDSVVEFVYLDANLTQPAGPGGISWTGTCSAPSSLFGGTLLSSGELDILYLCSTCPGVTPTMTATNTLTPTISPTITNSPTPSITQTLTPSLTQTLTPTITSTMTPTPSSGITGCLCYSLLNETGSPINYQYDDCVSGATSGSLNGGQSIQVCAVDLPTIDPGGTITPCSSVTNCSESSDCTGCS